MSEQQGTYEIGPRQDAVKYREVFEAAYSLLRRGERPSVRTIRAALGGGSPNTISEMLQKFWIELIPPAEHAEPVLGIYKVPQEVWDYTHKIWELMTAEAQRLAAIELTGEQREANKKQLALLASLEVSSLREKALLEDYTSLRNRNIELERQLATLGAEQAEALGTIQVLREESERRSAEMAAISNQLGKERVAHANLRRNVRTHSVQPKPALGARKKKGSTRDKTRAAKKRKGARKK